MTRVIQQLVCTSAIKFDYCRECYVGQSKGQGIHPASLNRELAEGGRKGGSLCQHLESVNKGQMDILQTAKWCSSLQFKFSLLETCSKTEAKNAKGSGSSNVGKISSTILFCG